MKKDRRLQRHARTLKKAIQSAIDNDTEKGLHASVGKAVAVAAGRTCLTLGALHPLCPVAFTIGLAAAGHTALRVACCNRVWTGRHDVLADIEAVADRIAREVIRDALTSATDERVAEIEHVRFLRGFVKPHGVMPKLRPGNLSWYPAPRGYAVMFQAGGRLPQFEPKDLKDADQAIFNDTMTILCKSIETGTGPANALLSFVVSANAVGKVALSTWDAEDAEKLNWLAVLCSRALAPDAETMRPIAKDAR